MANISYENVTIVTLQIVKSNDRKISLLVFGAYNILFV